MKRASSYKNYLALLIDIAIAFVTFTLGLFIRIGGTALTHEYPSDLLKYQLSLFIASTIIANIALKIYCDIWRYVNINYLVRYVKYATVTIFIYAILLFLTSKYQGLPRSTLFICWMLLIILSLLPKVLYRAYFDGGLKFVFKKTNTTNSNPILIVGISKAVESFIDELRKIPDAPYNVIGIIDNKNNVGRLLNSIPIIGSIDTIEASLEKLAKKQMKPTRILVSSEFMLTSKLQKLLDVMKHYEIPISRLPRITELSHNVSNNLPLQPIAVEDLLKRSQRSLNIKQLKQLISDKKVLITGAGGSIGSEIVRQVLALAPHSIHLLDSSEFLLYEIEQQCRIKFPGKKINVHLSDIRNETVINKIIHQSKPDVIFHAAALKHVPLLETHKTEAIKTNIFGTLNVVEAAIANKVKNFVFISTDKAVDPLSFMGSTKRVAEMICQNAAKNTTTKISVVRFGNVLGSNGSVVPLFEKQIANGGPITVTDKFATRYFMTIPEAVGLVMQSAALNKGKKCNIFVLDMGEPIKIYDLAVQMITLAGLTPNKDIEIKIMGLRPGEKLHEILVTEHESLSDTENADIYLANPKSLESAKLNKILTQLKGALNDDNEESCRILVAKAVKY